MSLFSLSCRTSRVSGLESGRGLPVGVAKMAACSLVLVFLMFNVLSTHNVSAAKNNKAQSGESNNIGTDLPKYCHLNIKNCQKHAI